MAFTMFLFLHPSIPFLRGRVVGGGVVSCGWVLTLSSSLNRIVERERRDTHPGAVGITSTGERTPLLNNTSLVGTPIPEHEVVHGNGNAQGTYGAMISESPRS